MRVLMVTDFYDPYVGGVEQHVRSLSHALVRRGHHVAVATLWTPRSGPRLDDDGPVTVHRVASIGSRVPRLFASADRPWAPPVLDPRAFVCIGRHYPAHVAEGDAPMPDLPLLFSKFSNTLTASGAAVTYPGITNELDYEGELAVEIGRASGRERVL